MNAPLSTQQVRFRIVRMKDFLPERKTWRGVCRHGKKFRASVMRDGVRTFVDCATEEEALLERARLLRKLGPLRRRKTDHVWSNTGIRGISDSVLWCKNCPMRVFRVTKGNGRGRVYRMVYYGPRCRSRAQALRMAKRIVGRAVNHQDTKAPRL